MYYDTEDPRDEIKARIHFAGLIWLIICPALGLTGILPDWKTTGLIYLTGRLIVIPVIIWGIYLIKSIGRRKEDLRRAEEAIRSRRGKQ